MKAEDLPNFDPIYDCCKICQNYEADKSMTCYTANYKYFIGCCLITDTQTEDSNVCDFFEKEE